MVGGSLAYPDPLPIASDEKGLVDCQITNLLVHIPRFLGGGGGGGGGGVNHRQLL